MYYEINVANANGHFFATAERSIDNERKLRQVYDALVTAFPPEKGWKVTVTRWDKKGSKVEGYPCAWEH